MRVMQKYDLEKTFVGLYQAGVVVGGTSAGLAIASQVMISGDEKTPSKGFAETGRDSSNGLSWTPIF